MQTLKAVKYDEFYKMFKGGRSTAFKKKAGIELTKPEAMLLKMLETGVQPGEVIMDPTGKVLGTYVKDDPDNLQFFIE